MGRSKITLLLVVVLGCEREAVRLETAVDLALPAGDRDARRRLTAIDLELWPIEHQACRTLALWRRDVCGRVCTPPVFAAGARPEKTTRLDRNADGSWSDAPLDPAGRGPWELLLRGLDERGDAFLFGCTLVTSQGSPRATLFRPWCDTRVCAGQIHEACDPIVNCEASPTEDDLENLLPPKCESTKELGWSWEQNGVSCEPEGPSPSTPCKQARIACTSTGSQVLEDGVCPRDAPPMCGISFDQDFDCDGILPGACGACDASDPPRPCRIGECSGQSSCLADNTWSDCSVDGRSEEQCDGLDTDCDGLTDGEDPEAIAACNIGRTRWPRANACLPRGCACNETPPCANGFTCTLRGCSPIPETTPDGGLSDVVDAGFLDADPLDSASPDIAGNDTPPVMMRDSGLRRDF